MCLFKENASCVVDDDVASIHGEELGRVAR